MNDYSYDEKLEISDFFDDTVPTFPFTVHAPPFYRVDADNLMSIKTLCKHLVDPYSYEGEISPELDRFLTNLATTKPSSYCAFEHDVMQSQGYISLMYIYDASRASLEDTLVQYTTQYLLINGYLDKPADIEHFCILPVMITPPSMAQYERVITNCSYRFIETIKHAYLHKVAVVIDDKQLIFSLSEILALSYFGYEINPPPDDPSRKRSTSYMDVDEFLNAVEVWGLERLILPPFVFEAPTKC